MTWVSPAGQIRDSLATREPAVPSMDTWRVGYLGKLLEKRDTLVYMGEEQGEEKNKVQELIE